MRKLSLLLWVLFVSCESFSFFSVDRITVDDAAEIRTNYGLTAFTGLRFNQLKIAVLDNGFDGFTEDPQEESYDRYLPGLLTQLLRLGAPANFRPNTNIERIRNNHGIQIAQVIRGICGDPDNGPQIRLYDISQPEMLIAAIKNRSDDPRQQGLLQWGAHIAVSSNNWPAMGNFDGTGAINDAIAEATARNVIWLNAAGNYGGLVSNHTLVPVTQERVAGFVARLPAQNYTTFFNNVADNEVSKIGRAHV